MIKIGLVIAFIIAIFGAGYFYCHTSYKVAVEKSKTRQAELLVEVEKAKAKREIRYVDKFRVVEKTVDACLDVNAPNDILVLHNYRAH